MTKDLTSKISIPERRIEKTLLEEMADGIANVAKPGEVPTNQTAIWWINRQHPSLRKNHMVMVFNFKKYCSMPMLDRQYILAAHEDGIYWNGDDIPFFRKVVAETEKMREDVEGYRDRARKAVRSVIGRVKVRAK